MQSALILTLFRLTAFSKSAALARGAVSRLFLRYPCFLAMTAVSVSLNLVGFNGRQHPYVEYWHAMQWPGAIVNTAAAIEAFWILAGHFRGIRNFGWWLIAIILAVSGTAAAGIALIHVNWNSPLHVPLLADQYLALSMMMTLLASRAFFRQFPQFPIRPNALRHLTVLTAVFATNFIGLSIGLISAGQWRWATSFAINVGANLAYIGWAFFMTPEGEQLSFDPPPPMSPEDFDHAEMRHKRSVERIKQAGSRGWRRLLGC